MPMIDLHIFDLFLQQKITLDLKGIFAQSNPRIQSYHYNCTVFGIKH